MSGAGHRSIQGRNWDSSDGRRRTAAVQDYLARLDHRLDLLDAVLRLAPNHRVEQTYAYCDGTAAGRKTLLHLKDALPFQAEIGAEMLDLLPRFDGRRSLGDLLGARPGGQVRIRRILPAIRHLVRLGFLVPCGAG